MFKQTNENEIAMAIRDLAEAIRYHARMMAGDDEGEPQISEYYMDGKRIEK